MISETQVLKQVRADSRGGWGVGADVVRGARGARARRIGRSFDSMADVVLLEVNWNN